MKTVKQKVWIITCYLKDTDPETGEEQNWTEPFETRYAKTWEEAVEMREKLMEEI